MDPATLFWSARLCIVDCGLNADEVYAELMRNSCPPIVSQDFAAQICQRSDAHCFKQAANTILT
eukprot:4382336-Amphidinium_carterae.1